MNSCSAVGIFKTGPHMHKSTKATAPHLHDALHVSADLSSVKVALGVAHLVQPLQAVLPRILGEILVWLVGLHVFSCNAGSESAHLHFLTAAPSQSRA